MGAHLIPPQSIKIKKKMQELMAWYHEHRYVLEVPVLAAQMHYKFICIHPLIDGNGRVTRLLMNLILLANAYPPAIILKIDRKKYYRVLNEANKGNEEFFEDFIVRSIERSLIIYLNSIKPDLSDREGFINLKKASKFCDYSQEYLSLLTRKGRLSAIKLNIE